MTMQPMKPKLTFAAGTLLLEGMPRAELQRAFDAPIWVWDGRVGAWRCDALQYDQVRRRLTGLGIAAADTVPQWRAIHWPHVRLPELRVEQRQALQAWLATHGGCVIMPTGTGKTEIALSIMAQTSVSTLVVAPVRDLMYQWHRRILGGLGCDAGIIGDNVFRVKPVSVTTYDSACIHMDKLGNRFGLIVFDECHHLPGEVRRDAARMCAAPGGWG